MIAPSKTVKNAWPRTGSSLKAWASTQVHGSGPVADAIEEWLKNKKRKPRRK